MEGILSQEEINALLSGGDLSENEEEKLEDDSIIETEYVPTIQFSKDEEDVIGEVGNISLGSSSTALSTLLSKEVQITTPKVKTYDYDSFVKKVGKEEKVLVQIEYRTGFVGLNILLIDKRDASIIGDLMMGNDGSSPPDELDDLYLSAVSEAMNQMMGSSATALAGMFSKEVDILPPKLTVTGTASIKNFSQFFTENREFITVSFDMTIEKLVRTKIYQIMDVNFAKGLIEDMYAKMNGTSTKETKKEVKKETKVEEPKQKAPVQEQVRPSYSEQNEPYYAQGAQQAMPGFDPMIMQQMMQQMMQQQMMMQNMNQNQGVNVQPAQFMNFGANKVREMHSNIDMIMDVPLQVTVELGRRKMLIKEILDLGPGSIVELDKLAGEPVDILVNNKLIAKGEVVVIDESFGVRITDIISKMERINKVQ